MPFNTPSSHPRSRLAWPAACALAWGIAWFQCLPDWRFDPQYQFGWCVPPLALYLFARNWDGPMRPPRRFPLFPWACAAAVALFGFGELLRARDPSWRLCAIALSGAATALSALWLLARGGGPLLSRQTVPLALLWIALPAPVPAVMGVTNHLLLAVTGTAHFLLALAGIPVLQQGNTLELAAGIIGVGEACSGLQSLQASAMVALFLGELFWLDARGRAALLSLAALSAFGGNLARILALALLLETGGPGAEARAHDAAGLAATGLIFGCILAAALFLRDRTRATPSPASISPAGSREPRAALPARWGMPVFCTMLAVAAAIHLPGSAAGSEKSPRPVRRGLDPEALPPGWRARPHDPADNTWRLLRFSRNASWDLTSPEGAPFRIYHFFWEDVPSVPPMAFKHTPAMCMPWIGWTPSGPAESASVAAPSGAMPAFLFGFARGDQRATALQLLVADGEPVEWAELDPPGSHRLIRLMTAWKTPRRKIDEVLLVYAAADPASATSRATLVELAARALR